MYKDIFFKKGKNLKAMSSCCNFGLLEHIQYNGVCTSAKIFFTSKFSYLLFCNPNHETETRTASRWGTTNSKPPWPIIMIDQSETVSSNHIIFITLFCSVLLRLLPATGNSALSQKKICWAKPACFDFPSSNYTLQDHIRSTAGHALSTYKYVGDLTSRSTSIVQIEKWAINFFEKTNWFF